MYFSFGLWNVLLLPFAIPIEGTFAEEFPVAASMELAAVPTFHDDRTAVESFDRGVVDYVRKPFRITELMARIRMRL